MFEVVEDKFNGVLYKVVARFKTEQEAQAYIADNPNKNLKIV